MTGTPGDVGMHDLRLSGRGMSASRARGFRSEVELRARAPVERLTRARIPNSLSPPPPPPPPPPP